MQMKSLPPTLPMAENFLSDNNKTRKQQDEQAPYRDSEEAPRVH